jgi:hypothetical protein
VEVKGFILFCSESANASEFLFYIVSKFFGLVLFEFFVTEGKFITSEIRVLDLCVRNR